MKTITDLKAQLREENAAKGRGGQITAEWLARCALAAPTVSLRSLVRSFKDIKGQDATVVSRTTVKAARGALVKTLKVETGAHACRVVAAVRARAEAEKHAFHFVVLPLSQDAADLRLRSREDYASGLPARSRASNVLGQVATLYVGDCRIAWPTELVALGCKDADTLVTALEKTLRDISDKAGFAHGSLLANSGAPASSGEPASGGGVWTWVLHIILQDGIPTNMAAAAALLKVVSDAPLGQRVRYFLVAMTCAAHTANLATGSVVQGMAAEIGDVCKTALYKTMGGTAVRLFKYLLSDYWEEFVASTRAWVNRTLVVLSSDHRDAAHEDYMRRLQELYTPHVVSDRCRRLFNGGLKPLTHVVADGVVAEAERPAVVRDVVDFVVRDLFTVDEHATLSRMFTYRDNLDHMFTMHLLGIPAACFRLQKVVPRKVNQKRMTRVHAFFNNPDAGQLLRRTCLGLQLTAGATALVSAKDSTHTSEKARGGDLPAASGAPSVSPAASGAGSVAPEAVPLAIRLCCGEVGELAARRREAIMKNLWCDDGLNAVGAIGEVLGAEIELHLRFRRYRDFPFALCKLCCRWFRALYIESIKAFLVADAESLDRGMSLPLQRLALRGNTMAQAVAWIQSKLVQDFLEAFVLHLEGTSLPAERKFAQVKKWETSRLVDVQTASENSLLQAFARERELASKEVDAALKEQRRVKFLNSRALAVAANPKLNPNCYVPYQRRPSSLPATASPGLPASAASPGLPASAASPGLPAAAAVRTPTKKRVRPRAPRSAESAASTLSLGSPAQASPTRASLVEKAEIQVKRAFDRIDGLLLTRAQFKAYLTENLAVFRGRMKEVREGDRRQYSVRGCKRTGLPSPKERGRLEVKAATCPTPSKAWVLILWRRSGWFGALAADGSQALLFLYTWRQQTRYLEFDGYAVTGAAASLGRPLLHTLPCDFTPHLRPLSALDDRWDGQDVRVFELRLQGEASDSVVSLWISDKTRLLEPLPKKPPTKNAAEADDEDNGDVEEEEDEDEEEIAAAVEIDSDVESSHVSCDSRVEGPPGGDSSGASGEGRGGGDPDASFTSSSSSASSSSELTKPKKPAMGGLEPALGGVVEKHGKPGKIARGKIAPWWDFTYYYIADNRHTNQEDCKIILKGEFCNDACFGIKDKSKTRTPHKFGETHDDPVRCHLLLRAWAWQRCFRTPFIQAEGFRQRDFLTEEVHLREDVARLGAKDKLLGNAEASRLFAEWLPEMAARLRAA